MISPLNLNKNVIKILENIISNVEISQNEIANQTSINRAIVSKEISFLETTGLINISSDKNKKIISFNHHFANTILIEIDRYYIHAFLNTSLGYNLEKISVNIDIIEVSDLFLQLENIIDTFINKSTKPIIGIGFAVHGIVEKNHTISYSPNTKWKYLNIKDVIEGKYDIYTTLLNVANISAITEKLISLPSNNSLASVDVFTGVGAGLMINDDLFIGANGHSLEIGHMQLLGNQTKCDCGATGCLETEISYPNLLLKMEKLGYENQTIEDFITLYQEGDSNIKFLYDEYISLLALAIRNLYLVVDPDIVKINCKIVSSIPKSIEILKSKIYSSILSETNISNSQLNSSTRCLGLSAHITKGFIGLSSINIHANSHYFIDSYK